ncbi:hypothetical protein GCE86_08735 [Micromonospora terminaliae]|uniref:SGNH/GDSL hydrolase family protein n=1 Tax=Micromonospora terminaliae TaxID=1914461 RepID=A0AAJ3DIU0_9ACTN|nr:SGNH/GDSL hydrolase family protein [Micromonospora terminaliae]NES28127.1 SGNH/GDSL hydrolase family protein [Micromonospora terminaliae]QGL47127.1 hypothetical protein GCE86_08735 [Micromonospora terminaliae]
MAIWTARPRTAAIAASVVMAASLAVPGSALAAGPQVTMTRTAGTAGIVTRINSMQPCPVPAGEPWSLVVATFVDAAGKSWPAETWSTDADGTWGLDGYPLRVPRREAVSFNPPVMGGDPAAGPATVAVTCRSYTDQSVLLQYAPVAFTVTGPSPTLSVSAAAVAPGGRLTVAPSARCPGGPGIASIALEEESGALHGDAEPVVDAQGSWPATSFLVPATLSPGTYAVNVSCSWSRTDWAYYAQTFIAVGSGGSGSPPPVTVALGDSFSSGEGNPKFDVPTDLPGMNMCHRAGWAAWPRLLGVRADHHLACSGDTVADLYESRQTLAPDNRSQLSRLWEIERLLNNAGDHVDRVTLTIGGNDIGFSAIMGDCFFRECLAHPEDNLAAVHNLLPRVVTLIRQIKKAAPEAEVVLVGYPRLFPKNQRDNTCWWLTPRERARANQLGVDLDATLRRAAASAGARFVLVADALNGHELCTADSWVFQVDPTIYRKDQRQGHPLWPGQRAIARAVARELGLPAV